jgi:hypothetical protein
MRYRTALGWRIFAWIFLPPMLAGGVALLVMPFVGDEFEAFVAAIFVAVGLGLVALCVYGMADLLISYVDVDDQKVTEKSPFGTKTLLLSEIKGVRQDKNYTHLVPKDPAKKKIKISTYVGKHRDLLEWLAAKGFDDLDVVESIREQEQILASEEFGATTAEREARLAEARQWAKVVNFVGIGAFVWALFIPQPYLVCILVNMAVPLAALVVIWFFRGLIRFDTRPNTAYPSVLFGLVAPGFGLAIRAVADFNILDHDSIWKYVIMLAVTLGVLYFAIGNEFDLKKTKDKLALGSFVLMMAAYSYGALILINCLFDKSQGQTFEAVVVSKEINSGKSTTYYLHLEPWGPRVEEERVSVAKQDFDSAEPGEKVRLHLFEGLVGTKWFWVEVE